MRRLYFEVSNDRRLPPTYDGDVLIWDIDKTYLDTRFSSLRGLASIPFEAALDKRSLPGAVPLLRGLRHGGGEEPAITPLYFVSGSPVQLRGIIERRMTLDGVEYDGITFKDQLGLLLAGRPGRIKEQVGYKVSALLRYRAEIPVTTRWFLFGDDVESDADAFLLFGEICAGLRGAALEKRLAQLKVDSRGIAEVREISDSAAVGPDPVERVFIHLEKGVDPATFTDPRVVPTRAYLQTALVLLHLGRVRERDVAAVLADLRVRRVDEAKIQRWISDAEQRLGVPVPASVQG